MSHLVDFFGGAFADKRAEFVFVYSIHIFRIRLNVTKT